MSWPVRESLRDITGGDLIPRSDSQKETGLAPARKQTDLRGMMRAVSQDQAAATSELTPRIGKVALRELAIHGFTSYEQLTQVTAAQLQAIHGVGPKAIRILGEELAARGKGFAEA